MSHIFISYAAEDAAIVADIAIGLKSAGYNTWYFEDDVISGSSYVKQISQALDRCQAFVLIASPRSVGSDQVTKEVMGAFERSKPLFPVLVELRPSKLKQLQPEWRHAIGVTSMVIMGTDGASGCVTRIVNGLKALGIRPDRPVSVSSSYDTTQAADKILDAQSSREGERKQVTVLIADVVDFTHISEQLDPEQVQDLIRECLSFVTEEIHRYEGTIGQFLGDGVMALFGAPIAHEDAPQRALYAALAIRDRLQVYGDKLKKDGIAFDMRIGLNSGLVVVGRIGDDPTMEYTATGDTVNLASRMESTAQPGTVQVAEDTYRLTRGYFDFKPLGEVKVKGKTEPVKAYELVVIGTTRTRLGAAVERGLTPFLGRQSEMEHLRDCYNRVKEGQGQVIGIVGEPGMGKSRLVLEFVKALTGDEHTYLEGGCLHYGKSIAYLPFLDILRGYFGFTKGEQESLAKGKMEEKIGQLDEKLKGIQPSLQYIFSVKVDDEYLKLELQQRREKTFEAIKTLLVRESQNRPLILAIEDLHWIDKTSDEFLTYLIDGLANTHILLILLYRPDYTPSWVSKTYYSQIRLDQLPTGSSGDLVQAMLGGSEVTTDLRTLILTKASGTPLFLEEFTRSLAERGYIQRKDGQYTLTVKPSDIQVPANVQGIIAARIDCLEYNLKRTVQVASVIGREFTYRILQSVIGMQQELKSYILSLQGLEFIYEKSLLPEPEYIFKHALTQEVAYNSMLLKRRREIHEKIGQAIENLYSQRLEEFYEMLAYHYSQSDNYEKAYEYLKLSGKKLNWESSLSESLQYYRKAIDALGKLPQTEENKIKGIEIRLDMASSMQGLAYPGDSLHILHEGEILCEELHDDRSLAQIYSLMSFGHAVKGNGAERVRYAQEAFDRADRVGDVDLMVPICADLSAIYNIGGESSKTVAVASRVIHLLENTHRESELFGREYNPYSYIMANQGRAAATLGNFNEGEILCDRALRFAEDVRNPFNIGWAQLMLGWAYDAKGDGHNAVSHAQKAIEYLEASHVLFLAGVAFSQLGLGHYFLGNLETSRKNAESAIEIQKSTGISFYVSLAHLLLGMTHFQAGDSRNARICIEQGLKLAQENNEKWIKGLSMIWLGRCMEHSDDSQQEATERSILQGIGILDELQSRPYAAQGHLALGELYADMGRKEKALQHLKKAEASFSEMGMEYWLTRAQQALSMVET